MPQIQKGPPCCRGGPFGSFSEVGSVDLHQIVLRGDTAKGCLTGVPRNLFRHLAPIPFLTLDHLLYIC